MNSRRTPWHDMGGPKNTNVTGSVYRHVIAPAAKGSARVMHNTYGEPG